MSEYADVAAGLLAELDAHKQRLDRIDRYVAGDADGPYMPRVATREYKLLAQRCKTNMLRLVVNGVAQGLYVDGLRDSQTGATSPAWRWWQANGMDARQSAVHRACLSYGLAYVTVVPAAGPNGVVPVLRGASPRRMHAVYAREGDAWPVYAVEATPARIDGQPGQSVRLFTETTIEVFTTDTNAKQLAHAETMRHGLDHPPVAAFRCLPDLEGRCVGEVEPYIDIQDRLNQTVFDLLVAQTFSSFKVRTATGMTPKRDDNGEPVPLPVDARRVLMAADPDTRFGQLDESNLSQLLESADAAVRHLAVVSQTPPQDLLGQLANLSAEALAAARDAQTRKRTEIQHGFGEAWEQVLNTAAAIAGDATAADDDSAQVVWRDVEARSLSQVADALSKLAQGLEVPAEGLWSRIPGTTATDIETWKRLRDEAGQRDPMTRLAASMTPQEADSGDDPDRDPVDQEPRR